MIVVKHKDTSLNIKGRFVKYIQTIGVLDKERLPVGIRHLNKGLSAKGTCLYKYWS